MESAEILPAIARAGECTDFTEGENSQTKSRLSDQPRAASSVSAAGAV